MCYNENGNEYHYQIGRAVQRMSVCPERLFGRRQIFYDDVEITRDNVREIVSQVMPVHRINAAEISKLYQIYRGKMAILDKARTVREDINNRITVAYANEIVTFKTGYLLGKPIQYVSRGESTADESEETSAEIETLNRYAGDCDKAAKDIELAEWFHICGTSYRYVNVNSDAYDDESPFEIFTLDPRFTFVVYSTDTGNKPIFAVQICKRRKGDKITNVWTKNKLFKIYEIRGEELRITEEQHPLGRIPIIEYPANNARLGAFEIVLPLLDAINAAFSDLADGREQFINALLVIKGAKITDEGFKMVREYGGIEVPADGDVKYLVSELNQTQNGATIDLMIDTMLEIVGMPKRSGGNGGTSDNGVAIELRDGWADASSRAVASERMFKKSENEFLRIALRICEWRRGMKLGLSSVEPHFERLDSSNILAKAQALVTMLQSGMVHPELCFEAVPIFSDPNNAYRMSKEYEEQRIAAEEQLLAESVEQHDHGGDAA